MDKFLDKFVGIRKDTKSGKLTFYQCPKCNQLFKYPINLFVDLLQCYNGSLDQLNVDKNFLMDLIRQQQGVKV